MKKIFIMFLVVVGFVFAVNNMVMATEPRIVFEDTSYPVVEVLYNGNATRGIAVSGIANNSRAYETIAVCGSSFGINSTGVRGYSGGTGVTYGVYGKTESSSGIGVHGEGGLFGVRGCSSVYAGVHGEGVRVGVEGVSTDSGGAGVCGVASGLDSFGIYSLGNAMVEGNLTVTGQINVNSLNITGAIPVYTNLARSATAMAKTQYHTGGYPATNVIDGIKGQWDNGEWASNGEHGDTWIQLSWAAPQTISKCIFYDRSNKYDNITDAWLLIEQTGDGIAEHNIHLGAFPIGGAEKIVNLTEEQGRNVRAMKLYIPESAPTSFNVGLSEWECYYDRSIW